MDDSAATDGDLQEQLQAGFRALGVQQAANARQLEALQAIYSVLPIETPLPPILANPWAMTADGMTLLLELILDRKPGMVVELGSGVSTLIIGYALKKIGGGRLISVDHDARFLDETRYHVNRSGLADVVDLRESDFPRLSVGSWSGRWYNPHRLDDVNDIELLVVDGPPGSIQPQSRYPAIPCLWPKLHEDAMIFMDDARRDDDLAVIKRWQQEIPGLHIRLHETIQGAAVIRRQPIPLDGKR